jgi:SAM-dependent methyltransferase
VAVPWVVEPLGSAFADIPGGARILDMGCGTGNYITALATARPDLTCIGVDISEPMLLSGVGKQLGIPLCRADITRSLPFQSGAFAAAFTVDVVHHLEELDTFFSETRRVLAAGGQAIIVTDSNDTLRERSLTKFFPEILELEQRRYHDPELLHSTARRAGLRLTNEAHAVGDIPLTDEYLERLESKCASSMRLITPEAHAAGMRRVRLAQKAGGVWHSHYVVFQYSN